MNFSQKLYLHVQTRSKSYTIAITLKPTMVSEGRPCTLITTPLAPTPAPDIIPVLTPNTGGGRDPTPGPDRGGERGKGAARRRRPEEGRKEGERGRRPQA